MSPVRSPAYLVVGIGIVLTAGLSGASGCASLKADHSFGRDAGAGSGGSTGAAGFSGGGLGRGGRNDGAGRRIY
jgi:hypothetical protein